MKKQVNFQELLHIVELSPPVLDNKNFLNAKKQFEEWKILVKRQRKILAKKYHPDKGGSLEKMQKINNAIDHILKISLQLPRPQRQVVVFRLGGFSVNKNKDNNSNASSSNYRWY